MEKRIENKKIERMLYDAKETLPTTNLEWRVSDMTEKKKEYKKYPILRKMAVCIAVVLLLGVGSVTVVGNMEVNVGEGEYGMWTDIISHSWEACKAELESRGAALPEAFGQYKFGELYTGLVVKQGTTYLEAFRDKVYHPMSASYYDGILGEPCGHFSVSLGVLDDAYWSAYYEFDFVEGVWVAEGAETSFEYEGMTIYGREEEGIEGGSPRMYWRWVDETNGVCFSVFVQEDMDGTEIVKTIIDMNK